MGPDQLTQCNPYIVKPVLNNPNLQSYDLSTLAKISKGARSADEFDENEKLSVIFEMWSQCSEPDIEFAALASLAFQFSHRMDDRAADYLIDCIKHCMVKGDEFETLAELIGFDVIKRCAMLDKSLAQAFIKTYASQISSESSDWLYVVSKIKRSMIDIIDAEGHLSGPSEKNSDDYKYCYSLLQVLVQFNLDDQLLETLQSHLVVNREEDKIQKLDRIVDNLQNHSLILGMQHWATTALPPKPGFYEPCMKALSAAPTQSLLALYHFMVLDKPKDENDMPVIKSLLDKIDVFSKETVLSVVEGLLNTMGKKDEVEAIQAQLKSSLTRLSNQELAYLLARLYVREHSLEGFPIEQPSEQAQKICQEVLNIAYSAPQLWLKIHQSVFETIPRGLTFGALIFAGSYYSAVAQAMSAQVNDQSRLWLYMAITTNSTKELYKLFDTENEFLDNTAIRNHHVLDATHDFVRQAKASPVLKTMILQALRGNHQKDIELGKAMQQTPLYIKQHLKEEIRRLTPDARVWVYHCLTLNNRPHVVTVPGRKIVEPTDKQGILARKLLDDIAYNPAIRIECIKVLHSTLDSKDIEFFNLIQENYIKSLISKLTPEEKKWVYCQTLSINVEETCDIYHGKKFNYTQEHKTNIGKLFLIASQSPYLKQFLQSRLELDCPGIEQEIDKQVFELGPLTGWDRTVSETAADYLSHKDFARTMIPLFLASIDQFDVVWLAQSLKKGEFDYTKHPVLTNVFLMQQGAKFNSAPAQLLGLVLIAIKYPELKKEIAVRIVKSDKPLPEIKSICLDNMPIEDGGFLALSRALLTTTAPIEKLSLKNTQTSSKFLSEARRILMGAPIRTLNLDSSMLDQEGVNEIRRLATFKPSLIPLLVDTISEHITDPFAWSMMVNQLLLKDTHEDQAADYSNYFYSQPEQLSLVTLYNELSSIPEMTDYKDMVLEPAGNHYITEIQRMIFALNIQDDKLLLQSFDRILSIVPIEIKDWAESVIRTGNLDLDHYPDLLRAMSGQHAVNNLCLTGALFALIIALHATHWKELGARFELEPEATPPILQANIIKFNLPNFIQFAIVRALEHNCELEELSFEQSNFDEGFRYLSESPARFNHLVQLNLKSCEITKDNVQTILSGICSLKTLDGLDISGCKYDNDHTFEAFLDGLTKANITTLSINGTNNEPNTPSLNLTKCKALANFINNPNAKICDLSLSAQKFHPLGAKHLLEAMCANTSLTSLSFYHCDISKSLYGLFEKLVVTNKTLQSLDLGRHNGGVEFLELMSNALKSNKTLKEFNATPIDDVDNYEDDLDEKLEDDVARLSHNIKMLLARNSLEALSINPMGSIADPAKSLRFSSPAINMDKTPDVEDVAKQVARMKLTKSI